MIQEIFASASRAVKGQATAEDTLIILKHSALANHIIKALKNPGPDPELTLKQKLALKGLPVNL
jgi:hypothetical protein